MLSFSSFLPISTCGWATSAAGGVPECHAITARRTIARRIIIARSSQSMRIRIMLALIRPRPRRDDSHWQHRGRGSEARTSPHGIREAELSTVLGLASCRVTIAPLMKCVAMGRSLISFVGRGIFGLLLSRPGLSGGLGWRKMPSRWHQTALRRAEPCMPGARCPLLRLPRSLGETLYYRRLTRTSGCGVFSGRWHHGLDGSAIGFVAPLRVGWLLEEKCALGGHHIYRVCCRGDL